MAVSEQCKERMRDYYNTNKEKIYEKQKEYRSTEAGRKAINDISYRYYHTHREEILERKRNKNKTS